MGNYFILSAFFSLLGLKREERFPNIKAKQSKQSIQKTTKTQKITKHDEKCDNQNKQMIPNENDKFNPQNTNQNKEKHQTLKMELQPEAQKIDKKRNTNQEQNFLFQSTQQTCKLEKNVVDFVIQSKQNPNIFYHNPATSQSEQNKKAIQNEADKLEQAYDRNINNFEKVKNSGKNAPNQLTLRSFKNPLQIKQIGSSHSMLIHQNRIKQISNSSKVVIFIKQGIMDFKDKYISRLNEIFNFHLVDDISSIESILKNLNNQLQLYPANLICHYSLFEELHQKYKHETHISKISIYNSSYMNLSQIADPQLLEIDQQKRTNIQQNLEQSKKYPKLGIVQERIFDLRQKLIQTMINQEVGQESLTKYFAQFKYFNQEYVNVKHLSLKSCLLLQQFSQQDLLTLNETKILQQKFKAKLDLIKLMQSILNTQYYLEHMGTLVKKQPQWLDNRSKEQIRTEFEKIEDVLKPLKQYKIQAFYQNHFEIDKQAIYSLEQLEQLKMLPITNNQIFWEAIQQFLVPSNKQNKFCLKLIHNYITHASSSLQLQYLRLYVSDLHVAIRQLYKSYNEKTFQGQSYLAVNLGTKQLDLFLNKMTLDDQNHSLDRVKIQNRLNLIQNQNFLITNKNKQKQIAKSGNVLLQISIKKQQRDYQSDYGFIQMQKRHQKKPVYKASASSKIKDQQTKRVLKELSTDQIIVFNILNTFYIQSIRYDTTYSKYIISLTYGKVSETINRKLKDFQSLTQKDKIISETYFSNNHNYLSKIKSQGDCLYYSKLYDQANIFFDEFLPKAKRQPKLNLLKISYIHQGLYKALRKKKLYARALDQLSKSTIIIQKIFGQKSMNMWNNVIMQAEIYEEQTYYQRAIQRLSTLLHLIKAMLFQLQRKPSEQNSQLILQLQQIQASTNLKIGNIYLTMVKQQLSQTYLKKSLQVAINSIGQFNPLTALIYQKLTQFYLKFEVFPQAVFNAKKALAIRLNLYGEHTTLTAKTYQAVAHACQMNLQFEVAYKNYQAAKNIYEQFNSEDHEEIISLNKQIGIILQKTISYEQSILFFQNALKLVIQKPSHGKQSGLGKQLYFLIGNSYKSQGDYLRAIQFYQKSDSKSLHLLAQNHEQQATTCKKLAQIYQAQGKYEKAINFYQKPLLSLIHNKGKYHKDIVFYYQKLGQLYMNLSRSHQSLQKQKSESYLKRAIQYFGKIVELRFSYGKNTFQTAASLEAIGKAYLIKSDHKHALNYFEQALTIKRILIQNQDSKAQQQNLDFAISYFLLGCACYAAKQYQTSTDYLQKSLIIKLKMLSQSHPQVSQIYHKLGDNFTKLGNYKKAQEYYKKTLSIYLTLYGSAHPQTSYIHYLIACMYFEKGEIIEKSLQCLWKAIQTLQELGLENQHKYFVIYNLKFIEIVQYLLRIMVDTDIEKTKVLVNLKALFFYLKNIQDGHKAKCDDNKPYQTVSYHSIKNLIKKLQSKLEAQNSIQKQAKKQEVHFSLQHQNKEQLERIQKRSTLQILKSLILKLQKQQNQKKYQI